MRHNITLQEFIEAIDGNCISIEHLAKTLDIDLKLAYKLLEKSIKILKRKGKKIKIYKAQCKKCGFVFDRLNPTKCPRCGSMWIEREIICVK